MTFANLGLSDSLLSAVEKTGYTKPTPIQEKAIPVILSGQDVMAAAQTGTGKTAGFTLPLLQLLSGETNKKPDTMRALILTPTRELAAQIQDSIETYGTNENLRSGVVFGGVNINPQKTMLRKSLDILVATPGRLLDLHQQRSVHFDKVDILILDEADRMLDMGFIRDIRKILALLPKKRQNLMFSATFSDDIRKLAKTICYQPVEIDVAPRNSTVEIITQRMYQVEKQQKAQLLSAILRSNTAQTLVFSRTKHGANNLVKKLSKDGITAAAIHGNKSQAQRTKALDSFKQDSIQVLVATDIAARGIDIHQLESVINFDLPHVPEDYVHRIGRTGRAGAGGLAISLVSSDERKQLRDIERLIKKPIPKADMKEFDLTPVAGAEDYVEEARPPRQPRGNGARGGRNGRSAEGGATSSRRSSGSAAGDGRGRTRSQGAGQSPGRTQAQAQNRRPNQAKAKPVPRDENGDRDGNRIDADDNRGNRAPSHAANPRPAGGRGANGAATARSWR
ncbi:MAG: DEAD/DEAH box helicase [Proteobacteria bacterium]|nr:DEAD/DEAH box helicase [Pseudomonadota bacterium]MDA0895816.1 DEAD/DEAH box helicase [Pseudomonadota bacterium]MDA1243602.1 DEAD/DEAH box helicase [Pseudomonadota bacterium]